MHIGFLDFQLFPDHPEFFGIYKFMNVKDHFLYSDKLALGVVDLKHIELANEEDKAFQIDHEVLFDFEEEGVSREEIRGKMEVLADNFKAYLEDLIEEEI